MFDTFELSYSETNLIYSEDVGTLPNLVKLLCLFIVCVVALHSLTSAGEFRITKYTKTF